MKGIVKVEHIPDVINSSDQIKSPRVLKSHLPAALLPDQLWTVKPKVTITRLKLFKFFDLNYYFRLSTLREM